MRTDIGKRVGSVNFTLVVQLVGVVFWVLSVIDSVRSSEIRGPHIDRLSQIYERNVIFRTIYGYNTVNIVLRKQQQHRQQQPPQRQQLDIIMTRRLDRPKRQNGGHSHRNPQILYQWEVKQWWFIFPTKIPTLFQRVEYGLLVAKNVSHRYLSERGPDCLRGYSNNTG